MMHRLLNPNIIQNKLETMKKKLTLLIFLFPILIMAQEVKNGAIIFDIGKNKREKQRIQDSLDRVQDSLKMNQPLEEQEDEDQAKVKKEKRTRNTGSVTEDWKKEGLFKAILHVGINGAQIDGDGYAGYNKIGIDAGVGATIRFHKYFSVTMELNYAQKGAQQKFTAQSNQSVLDSSSRQLYRVGWDYLAVPISINVQDKKLVMFSLGLAPSVMVRYKERTEAGQDDTNNPPNGQPKKFDLSGFAMLNFIIQKHYMLGIKFDYSLISIRGPQYPGISKVLGEYNNVLTFRFGYIFDKTSFKKNQ